MNASLTIPDLTWLFNKKENKKEQQKALVAKSEHNQLEIKKNVAIATLKDMKNKEEMLNQQMQETIEER